MGQNKALLRLGRQTLIEHVLAVLSPLVSQTGIISSTAEEYAHLSVECYRDRWPGLGPLGGIGTALENSHNDYSLILACDMPLVSRELLELLIDKSPNYQVTVPKEADGHLQPLCALYHRSCLKTIERLIEQGRYSPRDLFSEVNTLIVPFEAIAGLAHSERLFENVNTPEDLARISDLLKIPPK